MLSNIVPSPDANPLEDIQCDETVLGRIVSVSGARAIVHLYEELSVLMNIPRPRCEMGSFVRIDLSNARVIGLVAGISVPVPAQSPDEREIKIAELELLGELRFNEQENRWTFRRGVSLYPSLDDRVRLADKQDLDDIFRSKDDRFIRIGSLFQDRSIEARIMVDDLLRKHFAVLGTTGCGKSCTVALILHTVLQQCPNTHIVLLDPHNEYSGTFGDRAEYINQDNLCLPHWLLTFDELTEVIMGKETANDLEIEVLRDAVKQAKSMYASNVGRSQLSDVRSSPRALGTTEPAPSIDTPTPYRISDVVQILDSEMGRLGMAQNLAPYRRLKARLHRLSADSRYSFMFGGLTVHDNMAEIVGRLFRLPMKQKPIAILDVSGVPSEIVNVVVSVISRMAFDLALWSEHSFPLMLVCEEAHRYVPQDSSLGFEPTKRAIARIAREGRKYGVSLCVISQRPSDLDPTILSQCNTIFAMRMTNEHDQDYIRAACSDSGLSMLEFLPTMGNAETLAFGEGVPFPMRILLDRLPPPIIPRSRDTDFSSTTPMDTEDEGFLENLVQRWRTQQRG